ITNSEIEIQGDPTISCSFCLQPETMTYFIGLGKSNYAYFEIILHFQSHVIKITDSGNTIEFFETDHTSNSHYKSKLLKNVTLSENNLLKNYMLHLYQHILSGGKDNLDASIQTSQVLLNISELCQN